MAYEIVWLPTAEKRFAEIVLWLETHWSEKEVTNFIVRTNEILKYISIDPLMFRRSKKANLFEVVLTKHNVLFYRKRKDKVELVTFFDTRRNPKTKT